jgi:hypothetical protein
MPTSPHPPAQRSPAGDPRPALTSAQASHAPVPAARHSLRAHLWTLRQARSLRLEDAAARLGIAPGILSRIDTGKTPTRTSYLTGMLDLYEIDSPAERKRLADLAGHGQRKPWWADVAWVLPEGADAYLDLEAAATAISIYAAHAIPGIAQTRGYALSAARITRPDLTGIETGLLAYIQASRRQQLRPGCQLHLIISQDALIKPVATADVITAQLRHLLALADHPDITLQITTSYDTPPVLSPSFTILTFTDAPAVACCQGPAGQAILTHRTADATTQATFQAITHTAQTPEDSVGFIKYLINPAP